MEEDSQTSDQLLDDEAYDDHVNECEQVLDIEDNEQENGQISVSPHILDDQNGESHRNNYPPPVIGMEFESYDDAYNYYNCHAKELGFAIRVKSSWTKRNSKEKRGAVLCCNCEGFKTIKEATSRRKETRTGCLAMIRLRLVESNRWRVDEVKLEHNHLFDLERAQNSKSHKKMDASTKRKLEPALDVEVKTIKLYRTPIIHHGNSNSNDGEIGNHIDRFKRLMIDRSDLDVIHAYFSKIQLMNPNFVYLMDFNDDGILRNVFWVDSRSRAAFRYFNDVVAFDTACLLNEYEIPLFTFVGVNHHGESILLGCGLLADDSQETYIWLFRAWLTCLSGRPPQTIVTDYSKALQIAISEVFPRAHHRLSLSLIIQSILERLGEFHEFEEFGNVLHRIVYGSLKIDEFETAWEEMIQHFRVNDNEWLKSLFDDRERWAPVYLKDIFFAGMLSFSPLFEGYVHKQTSVKEFFHMYDLVLQKKYQKEADDDIESADSNPILKTRCYYELQLSRIYTKEIFEKFQDEVEMMNSCFGITQIHANGPIITYIVKEHENEGDMREIGNFEVVYDKTGAEVRCICNCFNFKGYLCRHALCVLNYNGVEEIPFQYILSRWRKDFKRFYVADMGSNNVDITNPVQWFDHLYRKALQVVEEGMISQDHYMVAWQAFKESLNKVRLVADKHV